MLRLITLHHKHINYPVIATFKVDALSLIKATFQLLSPLTYRYHRVTKDMSAATRQSRIAALIRFSTYYLRFFKGAVYFAKSHVSPSLMGLALSGSRRLPLTRVALVLFKSVTM